MGKEIRKEGFVNLGKAVSIRFKSFGEMALFLGTGLGGVNFKGLGENGFEDSRCLSGMLVGFGMKVHINTSLL